MPRPDLDELETLEREWRANEHEGHLCVAGCSVMSAMPYLLACAKVAEALRAERAAASENRRVFGTTRDATLRSDSNARYSEAKDALDSALAALRAVESRP